MSRLNYTYFLPDELLFDIFTRLSVISLGNCKCVSKFWNSIISDPYFIKTHLKKTSIENNFTLIENRGSLYFINFNNNGDGLASRLVCKNCCKEWSVIWGSCNGLILVEDNEKVRFLFNATTLQYKVLPDIGCGSWGDMFGFGYDSCSDDYITVAIIYHYGSNDGHVYIYTLKTNEWKNVGVSPFDHPRCRGIFVEGSLNWLAKRLDNSSLWIIASFNLATKQFSQILLPIRVYISSPRILKLQALVGSLCLTSRFVNGRSQVWVMKEYGVVESWTRLLINLTDVSWLVPLHLRRNSVVFFEGGLFVLFEKDGNEFTMQHMEVDGLPSSFQRGVTYVNSLVSPN